MFFKDKVSASILFYICLSFCDKTMDHFLFVYGTRSLSGFLNVRWMMDKGDLKIKKKNNKKIR